MNSSGSTVTSEVAAGTAFAHATLDGADARERLGAMLSGSMTSSAVSAVLDALGEAGIAILLARLGEAGGASPSERVLIAALAEQAASAAERGRLLLAYESANRVRDHVLATVAHDLRTPLSTISMTISGILRSPAGQRVDRIRVEGERVLRNVKRMNHLIRDLLDFSRIAAGKLRVDVAAHPLGDLLDDAVRLARPVAEERRLELAIDATNDGLQVACDRERTLQVLGNLLDNAIKFTEPGGAIRLRALRVDGDAVVEVGDDGRGIAPERIPHVFEPRAQAGDHKRAPREGVGIGLYISRAVIEAQGGRIWVESPPGRGTRFSFTVRPVGGTSAPPTGTEPASGRVPSAASGVMPAVAVEGAPRGGRSGANR